MSFPKPVPSKAALNALRGLVFTTSCSVVLLAEERRQRTKVARAAIENARKLHTIKARRNSVPMLDVRPPDADVPNPIEFEAYPAPRRRKRRKEESRERSQSERPRGDPEERRGRELSLETRGEPRGTQRQRVHSSDRRREDSVVSSPPSRSSQANSEEHRSAARHTDVPAKSWSNKEKSGATFTRTRTAHTRRMAGGVGSAFNFDRGAMPWGSHQSAVASPGAKVNLSDSLIPESVKAYEDNGTSATKQVSDGPKLNRELRTSEHHSDHTAQSAEAKLYRTFRDLQSHPSTKEEAGCFEVLARARLYLLNAPDRGVKTHFHQNGSRNLRGGMKRTRGTARKLVLDLLDMAKAFDAEKELSSRYMSLAVAVLRKFPRGTGKAHAPSTAEHPAGDEIIRTLLQHAMIDDFQAAEEIFALVLPSCHDVPELIAKLFDMAVRDKNITAVQWMLQHFTSKPYETYGFFFDDAFLQQVLQRHGRLFGQPKATSEVFAAVRQANSAYFIHIPRATQYDIHMLLLEGALVHNKTEMYEYELKQLQATDADRFATDPMGQNVSILSSVLNSIDQGCGALDKLERLVAMPSGVFDLVLTRFLDTCCDALPRDQFLQVAKGLTERHQLVMNDRWVRSILDHWLQQEHMDTDAIKSWLEYSRKSGWSPDDGFTSFVKRRLRSHSDPRTGRSILESVRHMAEQHKAEIRQRADHAKLSSPEKHAAPAESLPSPVSQNPADPISEVQGRMCADIGHLDDATFQSSEKAWLSKTISLHGVLSLGEQRAFEEMWKSLKMYDWRAMWEQFSQNYNNLEPPLAIVRLAVLARLRIDNGETDVTEQLVRRTVEMAAASGLHLGNLAEPLLMAQIKKPRPGPAIVVRRAVVDGHYIHNRVWNHAAVTALNRGYENGAIAICKEAASVNGNENLLYTVENFRNLLKAYVQGVKLRDLTSLLSELVRQNPIWITSRAFRDGYRYSMRILATRVVAKEQHPTKQKTAERCRQALHLMAYIRKKQLRYDEAGVEQPSLDIDKAMAAVDEARDHGLLNDADIEMPSQDVAVETGVDLADDPSHGGHKIESASRSINEGSTTSQVQRAQSQASASPEQRTGQNYVHSKTQLASISSDIDVCRPIEVPSMWDETAESNRFSSGAGTNLLAEKVNAGRRSEHHSRDAPSTGGGADQEPAGAGRKMSNSGKKEQKTGNQFSQGSKDDMQTFVATLKPKRPQSTWIRNEERADTYRASSLAPFDKLVAARRVDKPGDDAVSMW